LRRGRKPVAINTAATTYHRGRKTLERGGGGRQGSSAATPEKRETRTAPHREEGEAVVAPWMRRLSIGNPPH
jgi:hypothetical protein